MFLVLQYDSSKIKEYTTLREMSTMTPFQDQKIISELEKQLPGISLMVLKGIFRLSIRDWVKETSMDIARLFEIPFIEVRPQIKTVFDKINHRICRILRNKKDEGRLKQYTDRVFDGLISELS